MTQGATRSGGRKEEEIRVRVTVDQKKMLIEAAQRDGLDLSSWLRTLGLREASAIRRTLDARTKAEAGTD